MKAFAELTGFYVKIPNELLNDRELSWKAKGLFCHMASKKDGYNFTVRSIARQFPDGKSAVYSAMDELKERGWVNYYRNPNGTGKYTLNTTRNRATTPKTDNRTLSEPKPDNRSSDFPSFRKSGRINKKDLHSNKDIYKGEPHKRGDVILEPQDGDQFGSSTRYTQNEILAMMLGGVIDVH